MIRQAKEKKKNHPTNHHPKKYSIPPECFLTILFNVFVNCLLKKNPDLQMLTANIRIHSSSI